MDVLTYARYILETALLEYKFNVAVSESKLAAAALVLAFKVNKIDNIWVNTLAFYSGYTPSEVADLVQSLFEMLKQYPKENLKTVRQKYSHRYENINRAKIFMILWLNVWHGEPVHEVRCFREQE